MWIVPEPDYDDPNAVYTSFGLCSYAAQAFEQSMVLFVVLLQATHPDQPLKGMIFDEALRLLDRETLGQLLKRLPKLADIDDSILKDFSDLLERRNYLFHHYFREHADDLSSAEGRHKIIDELHALTHHFQDVEEIATQAYQFILNDINSKLTNKHS